tara:strand:- start:1053 stop:1610 length:558 start_codon:yes stop_codon:yes gene_type:complete
MRNIIIGIWKLWLGLGIIYLVLVYIYVLPQQNAQATQVYELAKKHNVKFPEIYVAQTVLETGWYKSNVYKIHNNLNGMMCDNFVLCKCIDTNSKDFDGTYCHYETIAHSVLNYADWQKRRFKDFKSHYGFEPVTEDQYYWFLEHLVLGKDSGKKYATDPNYTLKVKALAVNIKWMRFSSNWIPDV